MMIELCFVCLQFNDTVPVEDIFAVIAFYLSDGHAILKDFGHGHNLHVKRTQKIFNLYHYVLTNQ